MACSDQFEKRYINFPYTTSHNLTRFGMRFLFLTRLSILQLLALSCRGLRRVLAFYPCAVLLYSSGQTSIKLAVAGRGVAWPVARPVARLRTIRHQLVC